MEAGNVHLHFEASFPIWVEGGNERGKAVRLTRFAGQQHAGVGGPASLIAKPSLCFSIS